MWEVNHRKTIIDPKPFLIFHWGKSNVMSIEASPSLELHLAVVIGRLLSTVLKLEPHRRIA